MKYLYLLVLGFALTGCEGYGIRSAQYVEVQLPENAYAAIVADVIPYIIADFKPNRDELAFYKASSSCALAPLLERRLRSEGFAVTALPDSDAASDSPVATSINRYNRLQPFSAETPPTKSGENEPGGVVTYSFRKSEDSVCFTLIIGETWQFNRLYTIAKDNTLVPASSITIKR